MKKLSLKSMRCTAWLCAASLLVACAKEPPPPRSVDEFLNDPILLEATMVRCAQDRSRMKYEAECVNAREAANRMAVVEEESRRKQLEAQSERKRRALRRTQEAAAEARRRAAEAQRLREEAEYLGIYESPTGDENAIQPVAESGAAPAVDSTEASRGVNQPDASISPAEATIETTRDEQPTTEATDIDAIREELKRRQDSSG